MPLNKMWILTEVSETATGHEERPIGCSNDEEYVLGVKNALEGQAIVDSTGKTYLMYCVDCLIV